MSRKVYANDLKLNTINVVEYTTEEGTLLGVHSFVDNERGNKQAEKLFRKFARKNIVGITKRDIENGLDNGYCEGERLVNDYQVFITHSI